MTLGTIRPPLALTPLSAVGTAARVRVGRGRSLSRARHGRCAAVSADCGRSGRSSRNELRLRLALAATLARPAFMARLARMLVATGRPPNLDEFLGRKFCLGRDLRRRLRHRDVLRQSFGLHGDGKGWRFRHADHRLRRVGWRRSAHPLDRLAWRGCSRLDHRVFDCRRICRRCLRRFDRRFGPWFTFNRRRRCDGVIGRGSLRRRSLHKRRRLRRRFHRRGRRFGGPRPLVHAVAERSQNHPSSPQATSCRR